MPGNDDDRDRAVLETRAETVANLTHEIRGPVSTLRGLAATTLAHYDGLTDEERREFLVLIRYEAGRLERTVELAALALRLDAGTLRFDLRRQDLVPLLRSAVQATNTGDHPVEVDAPDALEARVDPTHIGFVFRQVVENAAAFSPPGSPIAVRLREEGPEIVIEVADRGPGIPEDRRGEVFQRFVRWRPAGYEDRPGPGLGLFLCREIARRHGGDASLADNPGGGTMLTVRLPAGRMRDEPG